MKRKLLLIVNPHAGRAAIKNHVMDIIDVFVKEDFVVTCFTTQKQGDPERIVEECGADFDRIVCCGGDGTVNEGLNGIMRLKKKPELGIIPVGVMNDYAYNLAIPSNPKIAAEIAAGDCVFTIDVGELNGKFFTYAAAFGLFTDVTYQTNQDMKNILGVVAYGLEGLKRIADIKTYHVTVEHDGGIIEGDYMIGLFSNSISIAGVRTAYTDALLDDGLLEIALIKKPASLEEMQEIVNVLLSIKKATDVESGFLTILHTKSVKITCDEPVAWTVDGECGGVFTESDIRAHQQAIKVLAGHDMSKNSIATEQDTPLF